MAQSGLSLTVSSVKEDLERGKPVYFLNFRFSTAHEKWNLEQVHRQVMKRGWQKLPDLESSYVWFGSGNPPEVTDILKKASYDNHVCRFLTGSLTDSGQLEGTGTAPVVSEGKTGQHATGPSSTLFNFGFSKIDPVSQSVNTLPDLEQVKPDMEEERAD